MKNIQRIRIYSNKTININCVLLVFYKVVLKTFVIVIYSKHDMEFNNCINSV